MLSEGTLWGGYFTLFGAAELQKQHPNIAINFISDRSIWDLKSRISMKLEGAEYTGFSASLISIYIQFVISSPDWARDSLEALESLKGRVLIIYHQKDGVVCMQDSIYEGLVKSKRAKEYDLLELHNEDPNIGVEAYPHNRPFTEEENSIIITEIGKMLGIHDCPIMTPLLKSNLKV